MAKLHLITYGCQMNEYDSERVAGLLGAERYELTQDEDEADLILVNTCAIREKAEDKVFSKLGELRKLKTRKPDLIIGVMGCMAQLQQGAIQRRAPAVDLVFGSPAIARVAELVERVRRRTRGRERSHPPETVLAEVRRLAAEGCREVTLLGQTVNAYGRDLTPPTDLATLLERVNEVAGIERIRFTTSNPYNLTPRLIRALREVPKVCEYFHLPLQSGSNRVLARMNRGYTRERYLELVDEIRDAEPAMAFSTDLIVGFPGETEADFEQTLEMVEGIGYDNVFVFRYSRRPGTPAAEMEDQVGDEVKARRNARLLEVAGRVAADRSRRLLGQTLDVLVDGASKKNAGELSGRTRCNRVVNFDGQGRVSVGDVTRVRVSEVLPHSLRGTLAAHAEEAPCLSR
ncbi:MAG: tRNA (N6-isopentenyl adenosine(37)-C2)-methylthiotransferase MiaB [Candidatus Rokuibacteriota bacterium]|nr:MAG: tRNA (N6-isopentenyl adenosine(37)-C2)-methylthiotransferase MiaB [Candidatus Rokubacteria bacterium]